MSYVGFIKTICRDYLQGYRKPKVLEVGIDKGQTTFPLVHNMSFFEGFTYIGLDISVQPIVVEQLSQYAHVSLGGIDDLTGRDALLMEVNSLDWLALNQERKTKFDLVLIDGDHNYKTVLRELELVQAVIHPRTIIVCDDYNGQWAEKDLYYSDRESYKENNLATPSEESDKQGVRTAVDEFINKNQHWSLKTLDNHDPAFLFRNDVWDMFEWGTDPSKPPVTSRSSLSRALRLGLKLKEGR